MLTLFPDTFMEASDFIRSPGKKIVRVGFRRISTARTIPSLQPKSKNLAPSWKELTAVEGTSKNKLALTISSVFLINYLNTYD